MVVPTPTARPFTAAISGVLALPSAISSGLPSLARLALGSPALAADLRVVLRAVDAVGQGLVHLPGQGVLLLRPVHGQGEHAPGFLSDHMFGHGVLPWLPYAVR
jgi:hypothetical protein